MVWPVVKRSAVLVAVVVALCAGGAVASSAPAPSADQATAYQSDPTHDGFIADAGLSAPLTQAWSITLPSPISYPLIANGTVFVTAGNSALYALNQATGSTVWSHAIGGSTGLTYERGRVFVQSGDLLTAFDAETGSTAWTYQLPGQWSFSSAPTAASGIVYTGGAGSGGTVYAVRESDGKLLWTQSVENGDSSSPAVDAQGVYVSYACQQAYDFDPASGGLLWHHSTGCEGGGGATPVVADGTVFVRDGVLGNVMLSDSTGSVLGSFNAGPPPAVANDVAFVLSGSTLTAIADAGLGTTNWTFTGDGQLHTAPLVAGGLVFVGSSGDNLYALDAATGGTDWSTSLGSSPTDLAAANGTLVVSAGTQLMAYRTAGAITTVPSNESLPTIDGSGKATEMHAADVGIWSDLPTSYSYQWELCDGAGANCADIPGAIHPTFTPPAGDTGSSLRVKVTATNGIGSSDPVESAASAPLAEGGASTTISLSSSQQSILGGDQTTLTARVTGTSTGTVALYGTPAGGSKTLLAFGDVGSTGAGAVSFTANPTTTTTYTALLEPGSGYASSTSEDVTVTVVPRSMPIAASHQTVTYGHSVDLKLTGVKTSGEIDLFAETDGHSQTLVQTATAVSGQHSVTFEVSPTIRTSYWAERDDGAAASDTLTVAVRPSLTLVVHAKRLDAREVRRHGETISIGATRSPALQGEPLTFEVEHAGARGSWKSVTQVELAVDQSGGAVLAFRTKTPGRYRANVSYTADGEYARAHSHWRGFTIGSAPAVHTTPSVASKCVVPDVTDLPLGTAEKRIRSAHCEVGKIEQRPSTQKLNNHVLSEHPGAGLRLRGGSRVGLVVGSGGRTALDQAEEDHSDCLSSLYSSQVMAQSFRAGVSGSLARIDAYLSVTGSPGAVTAQIEGVTSTGTGDVPDGTVLASTTVSPTSTGWIEFAFQPATTVKAGTRYEIVLSSPGGWGWLGGVSAASYPHGNAAYDQQGNGWVGVASACDQAFRTYVG